MNLMPFQDMPFNGDLFIRAEYLKLKEKFNLNLAIETGSCLFSTTKWFAEEFDKTFTVESNPAFFQMGIQRLTKEEKETKAMAILGDSVNALTNIFPQFINDNDRVVFFLDAHWEQDCPLLSELEAISKMKLSQPPVITVHDMFVPDRPELGFDTYNGQRFDFEWLKNSLDKVYESFGVKYSYYYNQEATGAMRGIIYVIPELEQELKGSKNEKEEGKEQENADPQQES
jgi:hypothetical protein